MLMASTVKMSSSEKESKLRNTEVSIMFVRFIQLYSISFIKRVARKSHCSLATTTAKKCTKKCVHMQSCFLC